MYNKRFYNKKGRTIHIWYERKNLKKADNQEITIVGKFFHKAKKPNSLSWNDNSPGKKYLKNKQKNENYVSNKICLS